MEEKDIEKTLKKMNISAHVIESEDTFQFNCQQCGQCCMNRNDIILNPFDVYQASKALNVKPEEFIKKYCNQISGEHSKLPIVVLDCTDKFNEKCGFLDIDLTTMKYKCKIHNVSPCSCKMHPIGTVRFKDTHNIDENFTEKYIITSQCKYSKTGPYHKVSDWMSYVNDNKEEIKIAHEIQMGVTNYIDFEVSHAITALFMLDGIVNSEKEGADAKIEHSILLSRANELGYLIILYKGYYMYDINLPFLEQAKENYKYIVEYGEQIKGIYDSFVKIICRDNNIDDVKKIVSVVKKETKNIAESYCKENNCDIKDFVRDMTRIEREKKEEYKKKEPKLFS